tara:strand:- start:11377 stop:11556 length:180 start_codon:yes stop_codon:yes gene_type:complete
MPEQTVMDKLFELKEGRDIKDCERYLKKLNRIAKKRRTGEEAYGIRFLQSFLLTLMIGG